MRKRIVFAAAAMLFVISGHAEEEYGFDTGDYKITDYYGNGGDIVIPDVLSDCPVEMIGSSVFYDNQSITGVELPETVLAIGTSCFYYNDNLTSVTLPESLIAIDEFNFWSCPGLTEIVIPSRVSLIGQESFNYCENLTSVTFTGAVPHMEAPCFEGVSEDVIFYVPDDLLAEYTEALPEGVQIQACGSNAVLHDFTAPEEEFTFDAATGTVLAYNGFGTRVDIPAVMEGTPVTAIGDGAFETNRYVYYVTIPEGVTTIGEDAFASMQNLKYTVLPSTLKSIGKRAFCGYAGEDMEFPQGLETIEEEAFLYASLTNGIYLPEGVTTVGTNAFGGIYAYEAYFPESIEQIGSRAFAGSNVTYLCFEGKELPHIEADAFAETYVEDVDLNWQATKAQMLTAQDQVDQLGMEARVWRNQNPNTVYIDYPDGGIYEGNAFMGYTGTETGIRPVSTMDGVSVTAVGDGAFKGNQTVTYFAVDHCDEFTTIGAEAFADSVLEYIDLFDSVTTIGTGAFRNCINMKELVLPESLIEIGEGAFEGCTGLTTLTILCDPSVIPEGAFASCESLETVYTAADASEEQIKAAGEAAGLPWYVKAIRIGEENPNVFYEMPYEPLDGADFWYDAEYLRLDMYQGYEVNLYLPREIDGMPIEIIGGSVLDRAISYDEFGEAELPVRSVVIPESVKEIAGYAFANCETLETVICYAPITYLNDLTFANCPNLREVVFVNGVREIGHSAFADCPSLETVYIGEFTTSIHEEAFTGSDISAEDCITDRAAMPDVDLLLKAVKSDPITPPEPETELAYELPSLDPEAAQPFIGNWRVESVVFCGDTYAPEEFEMNMDILLSEDGSAVMSSVEGTVEAQWAVESETAMIVLDGELFLALTAEDADTLVMREDGEMPLEVIIKRIEGNPADSTQTDPAPEDNIPADSMPSAAATDSESIFEQKFICKRAKVGDITMEAAALGAEYSVIFHEDGSLDFVMAGAAVPGLSWNKKMISTEQGEAYSVVYLDGTEMNFIPTETGFEMNFFDSMLMYFEP